MLGTYLFNSAGRGTLEPSIASLGELIARYDAILADPEAAIAHGLIEPGEVLGNGVAATLFDSAMSAPHIDPGDAQDKSNAYLHARSQWAEFVLGRHIRGTLATSIFDSNGVSSAAEAKITYLYGMGANNDETFVTNSGLTPKPFADKTRILIEDQPDAYGNLLDAAAGTQPHDQDFGRTHSITLIADSLAVINLFQKADPTLSQHSIESIIAASSNQRAMRYSASFEDAAVEADSLELAVGALGRLIVGPDFDRIDIDESPDGFGNLQARESLYQRIEEIEVALAARSGPPLRILELQGMEWEQVLSLATIKFMRTVEITSDPSVLAAQADGEIAFRHALRELNPFVVLGDDTLYASFNVDGELDTFDASTGKGLTETWLRDRAELALAVFERNVRDAGYLVRETGQNLLYEARTQVPGGGDGAPVGVALAVGTLGAARLQGAEELGNDARNAEVLAQMAASVRTGGSVYVGFGADGSDLLVGGSLDDRIHGGAGDDRLDGRAGDDRLEGGAGRDVLAGGDGDDTLDLLDGDAGDRAIGGKGYDTFHVDWGDALADMPEAQVGGVIHVGPDGLQLGTGSRKEGEAFFEGAGGVIYWENGGQVYAYAPGGTNRVHIEVADAQVPGVGIEGDITITGRPDLGIRLETHADEAGPRPKPDGAIPALWDQARTWRPAMDPLALDMDGDGFETVSALVGGVLFDHEGGGVRSGTGWLNGDDYWVVLDRDGDGLIDDGNELFGNQTRLPDGTLARDGFAAFSPLDTNADGQVDEHDSPLDAWQILADVDGDGFIGHDEFRGAGIADLRLWRDANMNGISEPFEMLGLEEAGIATIRVNATPRGQSLPGGNRLISTAQFIRADGSPGTAGALDLVREPFFREYVAPPERAPQAGGVPNIRGSGHVRDLEEAAAESVEVRQAVELAMAAPTRAEQRAAAEELLLAWAESSTMLPGTRAALQRPDRPVLYYSFDDLVVESIGQAYLSQTGGGVDPATLAPDWFLARQSPEYRQRVARVEALERFLGHTFIDIDRAGATLAFSQDGIQIHGLNAYLRTENRVFLEEAWSSLVDYAYGSIATRTRLAPYLEAFARGAQTRDFTEVDAMLAARRIADPAGALEDVVDLSRALGYAFVDRGWLTFPGLLRQWVEDAGSDPALAPTLDVLGVRVAATTSITGTGTGDVLMLGDVAQAPPSGSMAVVAGSFGNDILFGGGFFPAMILDGAGDDIAQGGAEDNEYRSGPGRDIILFGTGSGRDLHFPEVMTRPTLPGERDVLQFLPGVHPDDVIVRRRHEDGAGNGALELRIAGTSDAFIDKWFAYLDTTDNDHRILDEVRFADGTVWDVVELRRRSLLGTDGDELRLGGPGLRGYMDQDDIIDGGGGNDELLGLDGTDTLLGGPGDDNLEGSRGDDVLDGGPGDDQLYGGLGVDTYVLARGGGRDTVFPGNYVTFTGTAVFPELDIVRVSDGISPDEVLLQRAGSGVRILLADASAEIVDSGNAANPLYVGAGGVGPSIGRIEFADGTMWDGAAIRALSLLGATAGADAFFGYEDSGDHIRGLGGNDTLRGLGGDDVLDGGPGDDLLAGGTGADVYLYRRGDGRDIIEDSAPPDGTLNELRFVDLLQPEVYREVGVLKVTGTDDSVSGLTGIGRIMFADGTTATPESIAGPPAPAPDDGAPPEDDPPVDAEEPPLPPDGYGIVNGTSGEDVLGVDAPGVNALFGGPGTDTYQFNLGDGMAAVMDEETNGDRTFVRFGPGITPADLDVQPDAGFTLIHVGAQGDAIAFTGTVSEFRFESGESRSLADLLSPQSPPAAPEPPVPAAPVADAVLPQRPEEEAALVTDVHDTIAPLPGEVSAPGPESSIRAASAAADTSSPFEAIAESPLPAPSAGGSSPSFDASATFSLPAYATQDLPLVGTPSDPVYREIDARLDVLLQAGRANLSETYAQAIEEFARRRRQREGEESSPEPEAPSGEEIGRWNEALHAWHARHPGFETGDAGAQDGVWSSGWGGLAGGGPSLDELLVAGGRNPLGNPYALPRVSGAQAAPGLTEGIAVLG
ncbi:MAG: calcium-binding protein [Burkholderiales bacterium]